MDAPYNQVFFPENFPELFNSWRRSPAAVIYAGGTGLMNPQGYESPELPSNIIALDHLEELRRITRTERYIEIGAMVPLNDIINLGKIVPHAFTQALKGIGGPQTRNLATLGGNICHPLIRQDTAAALIALDARYELRGASQSRWISAARFSALPGPPALNPQELLTRIRIPLELWNYSLYQKFNDPHGDSAGEGSIVFIARLQKNTLADLRVVFTGKTVLREKNSEASLAGKRLPLDRRDALHFTELWRTYLAGAEKPGAMLRSIILNFIEFAIFALAD